MPRRHSYKEVRIQQLRSFCETARQGSLAAAASALDVAQPTVWEQVHALERQFGAQLIETHGRGCHLTQAGKLLLELAAPLVAGVDSLKGRFEDEQAQYEQRLSVAASQRILVEDLPHVISQFEHANPHVRLQLVERRTDQVLDAVQSGEADLGLTTEPDPDPPHPWLEFAVGYELEIYLVTPPDHPLARKRSIRVRDLKGYPLVNARDGFPDPGIAHQLEKLGAFDVQPRRVEAVNTPVIRRYVEMGFGIGIAVGLACASPSSCLHERSMSRQFGTAPVHLVRRRGALLPAHADGFAGLVRELRRRERKQKQRKRQ